MKNATLISVVLDRSGSMSSIRTDMEGGFNHFIEEQRKCTDDEAAVNLYQFDNFYEIVYENKPLAEVPPLQLMPRGATALLDSTGYSIVRVGQQLAKLPEHQRPARIVFIIITDGQENSSTQYSVRKVGDMIKHQTDVYSWKFMFLGANQDSFQIGAQLNIDPSYTINYGANAPGVCSLHRSMTTNMRKYRAGNPMGLQFNEADRQAATGTL